MPILGDGHRRDKADASATRQRFTIGTSGLRRRLGVLAIAVVLPVAFLPAPATALSNGLSNANCGHDGVVYPQGTVMMIRGQLQACQDGGWVRTMA